MRIHTTQDGIPMLIAEMENDHLLKTIAFYSRKIKICREVLENPNGLNQNAVIQALYPGYSQKKCQERANELIVELHEKIQEYVLEAVIRGLEISGMLQDGYGRKEGISSQVNLAMNLFFNRSLTD